VDTGKLVSGGILLVIGVIIGLVGADYIANPNRTWTGDAVIDDKFIIGIALAFFGCILGIIGLVFLGVGASSKPKPNPIQSMPYYQQTQRPASSQIPPPAHPISPPTQEVSQTRNNSDTDKMEDFSGRFCQYCGSANFKDAKFCGKCGKTM
jgi:ribosomal protein S27AE